MNSAHLRVMHSPAYDEIAWIDGNSGLECAIISRPGRGGGYVKLLRRDGQPVRTMVASSMAEAARIAIAWDLEHA
jgi:hypothetical protein